MLFYLQMRWNIEGRISLDKVFDLEIEETASAHGNFKVLNMFKVAGQRRVLAIIEADSADDLDRTVMGKLPLREYLEFEAIWPLRSFESFIEGCKTHFSS